MSVVDLASRHMPDAYPARRRLLKDRAITRAAANPNVRFVTISQFVKDDLSSTYDIAPERITAIPLGVDRGRFRSDISEEQLNTVRRHYALPDRFFLFVGMISPRKNVDVLIDGYRRSMVGRHTDIGLVLAGGPGWKCEEIVEAAKQAAGVRLIGYVNDADIPALYRLADAFVFPSSYEGFGLPVLEAMACGTPVIASGVSALPEVTGEAGIRLRAIDPDEVAAALDRLASDDILAATLRERGLHWVTHFSWDRVAVQYRSLYEACGSNIRP
jgi:glycosyltransferase involved in cell wall biosynthesis